MEQKKTKRIVLLGVLTLAAIVLGAIAVITSLRLRQLATVPVTPNAPASQPQAALAPVTINGCFSSFDIGPQTCWDTCSTSADCASAGDIELQCQEVSGVKRCVNPVCSSEADCVCPIPTATPSPTPQPEVTPSITPTTTPGPTPTSTPTATPTPQIACNEACVSDAQCEGDLVCYEGRCRNNSCVTEADCGCNVAGPTSTPAPTSTPRPNQPSPIPTISQPTVPQAGSASPTVAIVAIGTLLLLAGLGVMLVW